MRVRWAEVDKQGIVFNGHYLMYFDVGITGYYRALAYAYPEDLARHGTDRRGCKSGLTKKRG
jgi:acyl-CoA thioester hydrolase